MIVADDHELAAAARGSRLLGRVITLARWIGGGRPVSRRGELIPPDARALADVLGLSGDLAEAGGHGKLTDLRDVPRLTMAFYLAVETELIAVRRSGIRPGPRIGDCDRLDRGPDADAVALGLWEELFDLTARRAAVPPADPEPLLDAVSDWAGRWGPHALGVLYERQAAVDLAELTAGLVSEEHVTADEQPAKGVLLAALLGLTVRAALAELADHGAVTITTPIPHDTQPATPAAPALAAIRLPEWVLDDDAGITVRLTPLGTWAVRRALLAEGAHAPATRALT